MTPIQLHDGKFPQISWDEDKRIIDIDWKEAGAN